MLRCRVLGHRVRFRAEGETMRWECERGCGFGGAKTYPSADDARRYATAFDRDPLDATSRRPMLSVLPLWLGRRWRRRSG
jgi:hypothetical protein